MPRCFFLATGFLFELLNKALIQVLTIHWCRMNIFLIAQIAGFRAYFKDRFHGGLGDIPTKLLQPVPELKVDITSIETINPEWASVIPSRVLQKKITSFTCKI